MPPALRRAAPRLCLLVVAAAGLYAANRPLVQWACFVLLCATVPPSPVGWWRYVRHGRPQPWHVRRGGTARLFVTAVGGRPATVAARLRAHGPLDFGEAVRRMRDPTRPVWDDLTRDSADALAAVLEEAGAAVRIEDGAAPH